MIDTMDTGIQTRFCFLWNAPCGSYFTWSVARSWCLRQKASSRRGRQPKWPFGEVRQCKVIHLIIFLLYDDDMKLRETLESTFLKMFAPKKPSINNTFQIMLESMRRCNDQHYINLWIQMKVDDQVELELIPESSERNSFGLVEERVGRYDLDYRAVTGKGWGQLKLSSRRVRSQREWRQSGLLSRSPLLEKGLDSHCERCGQQS